MIQNVGLAVDGSLVDGFEDTLYQFDMLDAYLWRVGKLENGSYSLLLNKEEYTQFIEKLGMRAFVGKHFEDEVKDKCLRGTFRISDKEEALQDLQTLQDHWREYHVK